MKFAKKALILWVVLCACLLNLPAVAAEDEAFKSIDLDKFIKQEQKAIAKSDAKRLIKMAAPVRFEAKMKRYPEERDMSYIYLALEVCGVDPLPEVGHRMFVESDGGNIIPVYVEKNVVDKLNNGLKEEESAEFIGYHVYSYSKGPAILVVDFVRDSDQ